MKKIILLVTVWCIFLTGCTSNDKLTIGTQTYTETKILAYMYKWLIEDRAKVDVDIDIKTDLSSTPFIINAMKQKEIQLATMYTGEIFNDWFPIQKTKDSQKVYEQARNGFSKYHQLTWFKPLGFENTYAFTVTKAIADKYKLKKISDLKKVSHTMRLGVDTSWLERSDDGYKAFSKAYNMKFKGVLPMEISLVYKAVASDQLDIVLAYSSDARIKEFNLVTLEDDKNFFPPYDASTVVLNETLHQYPSIVPAIKQLEGKLNLNTIRSLNAQVDINKEDPEQVARNFLKKQGLIK